VSRQSLDWFLLNLVDVDLHSVIFSITSPIIMICISYNTDPSMKSSLISSPVPSLETSTAFVNGNLPPSSVPSLEHSFDSSTVPSLIPSPVPSLEPSLIPSTNTNRVSKFFHRALFLVLNLAFIHVLFQV
jgi:hypothetical protein